MAPLTTENMASVASITEGLDIPLSPNTNPITG
jgi:hypothetical protein